MLVAYLDAVEMETVHESRECILDRKQHAGVNGDVHGIARRWRGRGADGVLVHQLARHFRDGCRLHRGQLRDLSAVAPSGFATPYHTHEAYGEGFAVIEGEVTFFCDGEKSVLRSGAFIYLPGGKPHGFRVSGAGAATMLIVSPPQSTFGAFVREMGEPATSHRLPEPSLPDFTRLGTLSAKYGSRTLGPLPE
jgi:mannose-6-phosphate isomerase-like protein (cupin superfamily)